MQLHTNWAVARVLADERRFQARTRASRTRLKSSSIFQPKQSQGDLEKKTEKNKTFEHAQVFSIRRFLVCRFQGQRCVRSVIVVECIRCSHVDVALFVVRNVGVAFSGALRHIFRWIKFLMIECAPSSRLRCDVALSECNAATGFGRCYSRRWRVVVGDDDLFLGL